MANAHEAKPIAVGIAGGTASGKTTLADRLAGALQPLSTQVLHMDRYFKPVRPQTQAPISGRSYEDHNHPDSFDLAALRQDLTGVLIPSDGSTADVPAVVIVEGLMTLHDAVIRGHLDLKVFVDAQADERIVRRLRRNMDRGLAFDEIADFYLDSVRFRHQEFVEPSRWHADIVVNGSASGDKAVEVVASWVRRQHEERKASC